MEKTRNTKKGHHNLRNGRRKAGWEMVVSRVAAEKPVNHRQFSLLSDCYRGRFIVQLSKTRQKLGDGWVESSCSSFVRCFSNRIVFLQFDKKDNRRWREWRNSGRQWREILSSRLFQVFSSMTRRNLVELDQLGASIAQGGFWRHKSARCRAWLNSPNPNIAPYVYKRQKKRMLVLFYGCSLQPVSCSTKESWNVHSKKSAKHDSGNTEFLLGSRSYFSFEKTRGTVVLFNHIGSKYLSHCTASVSVLCKDTKTYPLRGWATGRMSTHHLNCIPFRNHFKKCSQHYPDRLFSYWD